MIPTSKWIRVTRKNPCPVCHHNDWCCVGEKFINCMRVTGGKEARNGGWLHPIDSNFPKPVFVPEEKPKPTINATKLMREWGERTTEDQVASLASGLGVSFMSLIQVGCAWAAPHRAWGFAMRDGYGSTCGIRLRADNGKKWAVTGSRQGIFLPDCKPQPIAIICEGPTDTSAGLTLGFFAIGRPSCNGGEHEITIALKRLHIREAIIIADNDAPGVQGASKFISCLNIPTVSYVPPAKDLRSFLQLGGTRELIESSLKSLVWNMPKKR